MWDAPTIIALATLVSSVGAVIVSIIAALKAGVAAERSIVSAERSMVAAAGSQNNSAALVVVKEAVKTLEVKTTQFHDAVNGQTKELKEAIYKTGQDAGEKAGIAAERLNPQVSAKG